MPELLGRLRLPEGALERRPDAVAAHNARRLPQGILTVGESADPLVMSTSDYRRYLAGKVKPNEPLGRELFPRGLARNGLDLAGLSEGLLARRLLDWSGPNVHTIVLTQRCNLKCVYCHASVVGQDRVDLDMTPETARRVVDLIFQSPNPALMIEFQGGEPLLNWPVLKFIVRYARKKNEAARKTLYFGLISNFSLLDDEKLDWLEQNGVSLCTSLDGPADLHDANRVFLGGNAHAAAVAALEKIQRRRELDARMDAPNAICTVTRASLGRARDIVDQFVALGLERVQLGPLDPIGFARRSWDRVGYVSADYVKFYEQALDYLIELSGRGVRVYEKMAMILLLRVLRREHWRFPNADGLCRLAYNHDGGVYVSEEGRLLANGGDDFFRIGDASRSSYAELLDHPSVRAVMMAASPEHQPLCFQCAYQSYCTVLPVYNYQTQGSLWGRMPENGWCEKMMGIFDAIFARLQDPSARRVLESWLDYSQR